MLSQALGWLCMDDLSVGLGWGRKSPFSSEDGGGRRLRGCGHLRMGSEVTLSFLFVCFYVFLLCWSLDDGELRARLLPVWTWVSGVSDLLFLHIFMSHLCYCVVRQFRGGYRLCCGLDSGRFLTVISRFGPFVPFRCLM